MNVGGLNRTDALIEPQRILDAIAREGIDNQPLLIGCDDFLCRILKVENSLVERDHRIDKRRLEMQARVGHYAHRLAKANQQHLLGFAHGEQRAIANDNDGEQHQQRDDP